MNRQNKILLRAVAFCVTALLFGVGCQSPDTSKIEAFTNRAELPFVKYENVKTTFSDSGKIVYRIKAPVANIYDKAERPYWDFPKGGSFDKLTDSLTVENHIECRKAIFYDKEELWELRDRVKATNSKGEIFETELLYLDRKADRIYTDRFVKITRANTWMTGYEFESNQKMTKYSFRKLEGIFPIESED